MLLSFVSKWQGRRPDVLGSEYTLTTEGYLRPQDTSYRQPGQSRHHSLPWSTNVLLCLFTSAMTKSKGKSLFDDSHVLGYKPDTILIGVTTMTSHC